MLKGIKNTATVPNLLRDLLSGFIKCKGRICGVQNGLFGMVFNCENEEVFASRQVDSPDLRFAGSLFLHLRRKEGFTKKQSLWRSQREGWRAKRCRGESLPLFRRFQHHTLLKNALKAFLVFLIFSSIGCSTRPDIPVIHVGMGNNRHSVQITGLDNDIVQEIGRDSSDAAWQSLIPVYRMPADTDLKSYQPVQPGVYHVKDNAVIFVPDTPFMAHQTYFVRHYMFNTGNKVTDFVTGHNSPGSLHYSDLTFK